MNDFRAIIAEAGPAAVTTLQQAGWPDAAAREEVGVMIDALVEHRTGTSPPNPSDGPTALLAEWAQRRGSGIPLGHVIKCKKVFGRWFDLEPDTLVPHPATTVLIADALAWLKTRPSPMAGLEIGTGCGVIALSLMAECPTLRMTVSERTPEQRRLCLSNAGRLAAESGSREFVALLAMSDVDVMGPFERHGVPAGSIDFIISNPPFLTQADDVSPEYRDHMPGVALYAPAEDPLHFYREIASAGARLLARNGAIFLEAPTARSESIAELLAIEGMDVKVESKAALEQRIDLIHLTANERLRAFSNHRFISAFKK